MTHLADWLSGLLLYPSPQVMLHTLVASGLSTKAIAKKLGVAVNTVDNWKRAYGVKSLPHLGWPKGKARS
jgi:transposase